MKNASILLPALFIIFVIACAQTRGPYIDGIYSGKSQAEYANEPYVGYVSITINNGWPTKAEFKIIDTAKNVIFDDKYERYFEGNDHYINQCRNDWKGIQTYPDLFIKKQNIENIDAISGATWSYNFFKYATLEALKNAK